SSSVSPPASSRLTTSASSSRACSYDGLSALSVSLGSPVSSAISPTSRPRGAPPIALKAPYGPPWTSRPVALVDRHAEPAGRQPHAEALAVPDRRRVPHDGPVLPLDDRVPALQRRGGGQGQQPRAGVRQLVLRPVQRAGQAPPRPVPQRHHPPGLPLDPPHRVAHRRTRPHRRQPRPPPRPAPRPAPPGPVPQRQHPLGLTLDLPHRVG